MPCGEIRPNWAPIIIMIIKAIERPIRNVRALSILLELFPSLTKENKATPKLKIINNKTDTIIILNTVFTP